MKPHVLCRVSASREMWWGGEAYLKRTKWQRKACDQAVTPPSGGGAIASLESLVRNRESVLLSTPSLALLLGALKIASRGSGAVQSGPYSSPHRVDAGEWSRGVGIPFSFLSCSIVQSH